MIASQNFVYATTIHLNDDRVVEGKIIQNVDKCIKVNLDDGMGISTYCQDEISDIDGLPFDHKALPSKIDPLRQIHQILQNLGYPENTWGPITQEIVNLSSTINIPRLKKEATLVKSNPERLKAFIVKLGKLIDDKGYIRFNPPHPLVKLLTSSLANDDLSEIIFSSQISFLQKIDSKKSLVACTAISQLGSIILNLLDIHVKAAFSPAHAFNSIPLNDHQILFVDFSNQIFEIVDLNRYYMNLGSSTMLLKDEYRLSPERLREINSQLPDDRKSDSLEELLYFLYRYIYISDADRTTPGIFINIANIYSGKGNYDEAISYYNKAISLQPDYAEGYRERAITYANKGNLDQSITDFNKAIELFPEFADAFHDRGNVYSDKGDMDNAIADFYQSITINPDFVEAYVDRGKSYTTKGDIDSAMADFDKAIAIDPYFNDAYKARAEGYFSKKEYDKSWKDIHKVEDFGDEVSDDLIDRLKKAAQFKIFVAVLIIAPVMLLGIFLLMR